MSRCTTECFR